MTKVQRFRKKPVEVEARRLPVWDDDEGAVEEGDVAAYLNECLDVAEWCGGESHMMLEEHERYEGAPVAGPHLVIPTLEGPHIASPGDWIIQGVQGEFYPCKPDIFEATYEPVEASAAPESKLR